MNSEAIFVGESNTIAAARSEIYRALSAAFVFPDSQERVDAVLVDIPAALRELEGKLPYRVDALLTVSIADGSAASLAEAYTKLFDNCTGRTTCPLFEKEYVNTDYKKVWEDIIRFYEHFDLNYDLNRSRTFPDWIATELEFVHYLTFLEASSTDNAGYIAAQRDFLSRHLAAWIPQFSARIAETGAGTVYGAYATALAEFIAAELEFNSARLPVDAPVIGITLNTASQEMQWMSQ